MRLNGLVPSLPKVDGLDVSFPSVQTRAQGRTDSRRCYWGTSSQTSTCTHFTNPYAHMSFFLIKRPNLGLP